MRALGHILSAHHATIPIGTSSCTSHWNILIPTLRIHQGNMHRPYQHLPRKTTSLHQLLTAHLHDFLCLDPIRRSCCGHFLLSLPSFARHSFTFFLTCTYTNYVARFSAKHRSCRACYLSVSKTLAHSFSSLLMHIRSIESCNQRWFFLEHACAVFY
jgi:hypothetical protein